MKKIKIDPEKWYSLNYIVKNSLFPWALTYSSLHKTINRDDKKYKILKTMAGGRGNGRRYFIKGDKIISFNQKMEAGEINLPR